MIRRTITFGATLLLLAAAALLWWSWQQNGLGDPAAPQSTQLAQPAQYDARTPAASPLASASRQRPNPEPLPPLDTPPAQVIQALEPRAEAGDAAAACRLAEEAARCVNLLAMPPTMFQALLTQAASRGGSEDVEAAARRIEREVAQRDQARMLCEEAGVDWFRRAPYLDLRAAELGHVDSALRFIAGEGFSPGALITDPALVPLYRTHAFRLFQQLLAQGERRATQLWVMATSSTGWSALSAVLPPEWQDEGVAHALHYKVRPATPGFDTQQYVQISAEAEARAEELHARYFSQTPPPPAPPPPDARQECEQHGAAWNSAKIIGLRP